MQLDVAGFKNPVLVRNGMGERVGAVCMSDRQHHHDHPGLFFLLHAYCEFVGTRHLHSVRGLPKGPSPVFIDEFPYVFFACRMWLCNRMKVRFAS